MYMQMLRNLRRYWLFFILGMMVLAFLVDVLDVRFLQPGACEELPGFRDDVPQDVRDTMGLLHEHELLYCKRLREGMATVEPMVYWGSDGMNSFLFFQALEGEDLRGVGVPDYQFRDASNSYYPSRQGDRRHPRFDQQFEGGRIWRNLAEGEEPAHFWRVDGAPGLGMAALYLKIRGPATEQESIADRDFFADLERAWSFVRGQGGGASGQMATSREATILIVPERWYDLIHRETNPALLNEAGDRTDFSRLAQEDLPEPILYESVQALTGSTVWVAGIISGTTPSMVLLEGPYPGDASGGEGFESERIEPIESVQWISLEGGSSLQYFHFPRQPDSSLLTALFWSDGDESAEPDKRWPVVFTMPVEAPEDGGS